MPSLINQIASELSIVNDSNVHPIPPGIIPILGNFNAPNVINQFLDVISILPGINDPFVDTPLEDQIINYLPKGVGNTNSDYDVPTINKIVMIHQWLLNGIGGNLSSILGTLLGSNTNVGELLKIIDILKTGTITPISGLGILETIVKILDGSSKMPFNIDELLNNEVISKIVSPLIGADEYNKYKNIVKGGNDFYDKLINGSLEEKKNFVSYLTKEGENIPMMTNIEVLPFKGYIGNNLGSFELGSEGIWDIKIESYYHKGIKVPRTLNDGRIIPSLPEPPSINGFLPITNFSVTETKTTLNEVSMYESSSISIPDKMVIDKSITVTMFDDRFYRIKSWLEEYRDYAYGDFKTMPYKHCCYEITIWVLDFNRSILYQKSYLGIIDEIDMGINATEQLNSNITRTISFVLVGEDSSPSFSSQLKPIQKLNEQRSSTYNDNKENPQDVDNSDIVKVLSRTPVKKAW